MAEQAKDFLVWVGGASYSRESFVEEARRMGACRRVPFVPEGVVRGESRILLISDMTDADRERYKAELRRRDLVRYHQWKDSGLEKFKTHVAGPMPRGTPTIFAYFTVRDIVYVVGSETNIPKRFEKLGVSIYEYDEQKFGFNDERDSGSLKIGGIYLLSEGSMRRIETLAQSGSLDGNITSLRVPYPYADKRFRGIKAISRAMADRLVGEKR